VELEYKLLKMFSLKSLCWEHHTVNVRGYPRKTCKIQPELAICRLHLDVCQICVQTDLVQRLLHQQLAEHCIYTKT